MKHHRPIPTYVLAALVTIGPIVSVPAHEYDRNDSDHPFRVFSYLLHPIGVALEYTITRPVHWIAHQPHVGYFVGHQVPGVRQTEPIGGFPIPPPFKELQAERFNPPAISPDIAPPVESPEIDEVTQTKDHTAIDDIDLIDLSEQSILDGTIDPLGLVDEPIVEPLIDTPEEKPIVINITDEGIHFTIAGEAVLFDSGSADLSASGKELLKELAARIATDYPERELLVQGYTDNEPIQHSAWKSNWELGAARALTLVHYLVDNAGFAPDKVAALTDGAHRAIEPNTTAEQKALNRRAIITVRSVGA